MAKGDGVGCAALSALCLALVACGGSGGGSGGATLTSYAGCLPPCVDSALQSCLGSATSCTSDIQVTCWDSSARKVTSVSSADGGASANDDLVYAPDGSLCLTVHSASMGPGGTPTVSYTDASGNVVASGDYDSQYGPVYRCDGKIYVAKPVSLSATCSDNAHLLLGQGCTQSSSCQ